MRLEVVGNVFLTSITDTKGVEDETMTHIRKTIAFTWIAIALVFWANWHPELDASDLDSYLFNREARIDEAWELSAPVQDSE